jgi:stage V sporulation protein SpoVS
MNAHQKQDFLVCITATRIKKHGFHTGFGLRKAPQPHCGTSHKADARKVASQPAAICAKASHKLNHERQAIGEASLNKRVKELDAQLDQLANDHYAQLSVAEIQQLVVNDKWLARMNADVQGELDRVSQTLTRRIRELAERYAMPLPGLVDEVEALSTKVGAHLQRIGTAA